MLSVPVSFLVMSSLSLIENHSSIQKDSRCEFFARVASTGRAGMTDFIPHNSTEK